MSQKIFIGPMTKGLEQFYLPFNIDNDAFPTLLNAYTWRGRVKKKRGTVALDRLRRQIQITSFNLSAGAGNLVSSQGLEATATITPKTISIVVSGQTYTDLNADGTLQGNSSGKGTIDYSTGDITIDGGGGSAVTGTFSYFPGLPVMGLRNFIVNNSQYPVLIAFDTKYSYQISINTALFFSTSYYKKSYTPVTWSGANYQQFWTTNYQGALWATNGVPGFRFAKVYSVADQASTTITMVLHQQTVNAPLTTLKNNDYLFFNEGTAVTAWTLNGQTGFISDASGSATGTYIVTFPTSQTSTGYNAGTAIAQLLTSSATGSGDGIRWYDGDPTTESGLPAGTGKGWVNFSPPLFSGAAISIDDKDKKKYYLVGATSIFPFKDRIIFFAPWIQATDGTAAIQLNDVALWSWNGTPYYSMSPDGITSDSTAYYVDQTGKGGWLSAGIDQSIITVNNNEDVLLVGFTNKQTRFVYTGNDLFPFLFYNINSELGSAATFSGITLDRGALSFGLNGLILTTQTGAQRIDLSIPDQVFNLKGPTNVFAAQRISAERDFYHEWVYFTFVPDDSRYDFPTQTLQYNYRENSWAIHYENFTAHGPYRKQKSYTWATLPFQSWESWGESWNSGITTALFPNVVAGNPQGFVVIKGEGVGEAPTGNISAVTSDSSRVKITSTNHCVNIGDYLYITNLINGVIINGNIGRVDSIVDDNNFILDTPYVNSYSITGATKALQSVLTIAYPPDATPFSVGQKVTISGVVGMVELNGNTYQITAVSGSTITLDVDSTGFTTYVSGGTATLIAYQGAGVYTRLIQPFIQTKQFPIYWSEGRQVRIGVQKYLLDRTTASQATLNIYLSQDPGNARNSGPLVPNDNTINNSLEYSTVLFTSPETNNLQTPTGSSQFQIWHRINTSLIGETFQIGITLDDAQMRNLGYATDEITLHAMQIDVSPGPLLA